MKSTGMVRHLDKLGRVVIPMELRKSLGISSQQALEIFVNGQQIILQKHESCCSLCGSAADGMTDFNGRTICPHCVSALRKIL